VVYDPLILSGDPAPGMSQNFVSFPYFSFVNDANYTIFLGAVSPHSPHSPDAIFLARHRNPNPGGGQPPELSLVARLNQPAPGMPDGTSIIGFDINYHRVNSLGQAVFHAYLAGPGILGTGDDNTNAHSGWIYSPDSGLTRVYQWRDPAPGIPGAKLRTAGRITLNDLGHVAFSADLSTESEPFAGNAFYYGRPGDLQPIARTGQAVPGRPDLTFTSLWGFDYPVLSSNGKIAFSARVAGPGLPPMADGAVLVGQPGDLQLLALSGQAAPGTNTTYRNTASHTPLDVNNNGQASFAMLLDDGGRGLFAGKPGDVRLVARTQTPAPGLPGRSFDFFYGADINDRGAVAFAADLDDGDERFTGIYLSKPNDDLHLIAARSQHAPGTDPDVRFGWFFSDPVINKDGQVAFFASLEGQGSRGEGDYGIFATGHSGELRLVARVGDPFEVAPGDSRTITALSYAGIFGSHVLSFNEESNLSFLIKFDDGSQGIFTARVLPEPATLLLLPALAMLTLRRRRPSARTFSACRPYPIGA
jgi:hypothetical protein